MIGKQGESPMNTSTMYEKKSQTSLTKAGLSWTAVTKFALLAGILLIHQICEAQIPVVSGLKLDLSAQTGVLTSGSSVTNWVDQSGNNNGVSQTSLSAEPTLVLNAFNGRPVVRFDGN